MFVFLLLLLVALLTLLTLQVLPSLREAVLVTIEERLNRALGWPGYYVFLSQARAESVTLCAVPFCEHTQYQKAQGWCYCVEDCNCVTHTSEREAVQARNEAYLVRLTEAYANHYAYTETTTGMASIVLDEV